MPNYYRIEPGRHNGEIVEMSTSPDKAGCQVVEWLVRVLDGPDAGEIISKRFYMKGKGIDFLHKEMEMLGLPFTNQRDFHDVVKKAKGICFTFEAVTSEEGFQSYYVKELLEPGSCSGETDQVVGW